MPLKTSSCEELPSINLTSMIDVVFLLIIFFMVGTKFTDVDRQIGIKLPGVGSLQAMVAPPDRRYVVVASDGSIQFDRQSVSLEQLTTRLNNARLQYPALGVVVNGDRGVAYERVASVIAAVDRAGVKDVSIGVSAQPAQLR